MIIATTTLSWHNQESKPPRTTEVMLALKNGDTWFAFWNQTTELWESYEFGSITEEEVQAWAHIPNPNERTQT